jgi:hypothetical protein
VKLEDFFSRIGPFLRGQASHADTVRALYGTPEGKTVQDARRLAIYGRFARLHRFEVVDSIFPHLRRAVVARGGEAAWDALTETYFQRHPMRHFELNTNAVHLPEFLQGYAEEAGLPAWMPELADFEWWEWQAIVAPGEDAEADGPRISATVELRPYTHDFVGWLDAPEAERAPEPEAGECIVLFWRSPQQRLRRENATPEELLVLKAVAEGYTLGDAAAAAGASLEALEATFDDLARAGILVGVE